MMWIPAISRIHCRLPVSAAISSAALQNGVMLTVSIFVPIFPCEKTDFYHCHQEKAKNYKSSSSYIKNKTIY
jgi:hypothetical protein